VLRLPAECVCLHLRRRLEGVRLRVHDLMSALPLALHITSEMARSRQLILPGGLLLVGLHHLMRVLLASDCWLMVLGERGLLRRAWLRPFSLLCLLQWDVHMLLSVHAVSCIVARAWRVYARVLLSASLEFVVTARSSLGCLISSRIVRRWVRVRLSDVGQGVVSCTCAVRLPLQQEPPIWLSLVLVSRVALWLVVVAVKESLPGLALA